MRERLLTLALSPLLNIVLNKIMFFYLGAHGVIKRRYAWMAWEFVQIFATSVTGIVTAIVRFALAIVATLFAVQRMDASCFPGWLDEIIQLDSLAKAFRSMLVCFHHHNNPTMHVALWRLQEGAAARRAGAAGMLDAQSTKLKVAKRWRKAAIRVLNPQLGPYRSGLSADDVLARAKSRQKSGKRSGTGNQVAPAASAEGKAQA